jgi:hypothetical protein
MCYMGNCLALKHGFDYIDSVGGMLQIQEHTHSLAKYLVEQLRNLRHEIPMFCNPVTPLLEEPSMIIVYGWEDAECQGICSLYL